MRVPSNIVEDALLQFDWPFAAWAKVGFDTKSVFLGATLVLAALAAAQILRDRLPELSLWLLAEAGLLIVSNDGVVTRAENFARVAPLAMAAFVLSVAICISRRSTIRPALPAATAPSSAERSGSSGPICSGW